MSPEGQTQPRMFYFGPWGRAGHHYFRENGMHVSYQTERELPWKPGDIDGKLQPGCYELHPGYWSVKGKDVEGEALLHKKNGWTAISFWDSSVDKRGRCNSTYIAEGDFTFAQMVQMSSERFSQRWGKMSFEVRLALLGSSI